MKKNYLSPYMTIEVAIPVNYILSGTLMKNTEDELPPRPVSKRYI